MTENALIPASVTGSDETALAVAQSSAKFLPRIQLCQAQTKLVLQRKVARGGHFALVDRDNVVDLGNEVEVVVCAGRAKAMQFDDETVINNFDKDSDTFKSIQERSGDRDSGCMYGPEYLLYLPNQERFVTFFMASTTLRREASQVHSHMGQQALLASHPIETKKYTWFGSKCEDLSTPVELPDMKIIQEEIDKFKNEKSTDLEVVDEDEDENSTSDRER